MVRLWRNTFFKKFYLFIFGCVGSSLLRVGFLQLRRAGAPLHCGAQGSPCGGFFCSGAQAPGSWASVVVAHGLQSAGSAVVAHRLRCSAACGIFPDQGLNPCPLHWQAHSQPLRHQGSPCFYIFKGLLKNKRRMFNRDCVWPSKPKIFIWPFMGKVCQPLV